LEFRPCGITPGNYRFAVGTAGSATLVLQTILLPLLTANGVSTLTLEGGTHNPFAPPFDFLARCFVPLIQRMGPTIELELCRPGFFPAGGGKFHARIEPVKKLQRFDLIERGTIRQRRARAIISKLPVDVADRELFNLMPFPGTEKSVWLIYACRDAMNNAGQFPRGNCTCSLFDNEQ
jgi:RNA 3'-terminal phosphate cyclase (ATP)